MAVWGGVRLSDVLRSAGVPASTDGLHVAFLGLDDIPKPDGIIHFGGSIPLEKALQDDVLLAYEMNGEPLPPEHGYPLRVVVPGYIGARSVKWLGNITVQDTPSDNYYQQKSYKLFPADITQTTVNWAEGIMLQEQVLNSVICSHTSPCSVPAGSVIVQGYAHPNHDCAIHAVEVSADGGKIWQPAEIVTPIQTHQWVFWQIELELPIGRHEIVVRAFDSSGNSQPEHIETVWNFKGYFNNAYHRVMVDAV
jgi:sulfite oxidase